MKNPLTAVFAGSLLLLLGTLLHAIEFDLAAKVNGVGISKTRLQEHLESYMDDPAVAGKNSCSVRRSNYLLRFSLKEYYAV